MGDIDDEERHLASGRLLGVPPYDQLTQKPQAASVQAKMIPRGFGQKTCHGNNMLDDFIE